MKVTSKKTADTSDFKNNILMPHFYINNTNEVCLVCAVLVSKKLILSYQLCQEIKIYGVFCFSANPSIAKSIEVCREEEVESVYHLYITDVCIRLSVPVLLFLYSVSQWLNSRPISTGGIRL